MKFIVNIPGRATADADEIYVWIAKRSPQGALHWHLTYLAAAASLSDDPHRHPLAHESSLLHDDVRELHFKTRRGKKYRLLFAISGNVVRVLSVRAPGLPPVVDNDLS